MKNNYSNLLLVTFLLFNLNSSAQLKIACVGNSITYGYGLSSPSTQSYPSQMQVLLGAANWTVGNFGVSSRTMLKKGDKPYWNETAYTNAKAMLLNEVMILLGTNDAKTYNWNPYGNEFVSNYEEMIQVFRNLTSKPDMWLGLIPPGQNVGWSILFGNVKDSVNTSIKQIALESGAGLIDLFDTFNGNSSTWYNSTTFQADSIHPKTAGAAIIAQKVKEMITMSKPVLTYNVGKITTSITAFSYQWYYNGSMIVESEGGKNAEFVPAKTGNYKVSLKINANNETRIVSEEIAINSLTKLVEVHNQTSLKMYPNPVTEGKFKINVPCYTNFDVSLYDVNGKLCWFKKVCQNNEILNISQLNNGSYVVGIVDKQQNNYSGLIRVL